MADEFFNTICCQFISHKIMIFFLTALIVIIIWKLGMKKKSMLKGKFTLIDGSVGQNLVFKVF